MRAHLSWLCIALTAAPLAAQEVLIDQLQSVTSSIGGRDAPVWMPDGSKIVYLSEQDGGLWSVAPGGSPSRIASGVASVNPRSNVALRISPDGRFVSFLKGADGGTDIFLFDLASRTTRRLTAQGARIVAYAFSPDSKTIAFGSNR